MLYEQARDPLEVLDGGTDSGLQLDDGLSAGSDLVVDNDLEVQLFVVEHTLDSATLHVQVVGVEDLSAGGGKARQHGSVAMRTHTTACSP